MVEAIFFDLYETLITEWKDQKRKAPYSVVELGFDIDEEAYREEWSRRRDERMDGTFPNHQSVLRDILSSLGKPIDKHIIKKIHQQRVQSKLVPFKEIDPEIIQILQTIKARKIKIGLISNCTEEEIVGWERSSLAPLFDDVIFSYQAKQAKPNPEIYLMACNNLKVKPENSLFIGDGGSNELPGAAKVGMKAYQATWFLPRNISEKVTRFQKLGRPMEILDLIEI